MVFASAIGTPLDAANVRREFRKITESAGLGTGLASRGLRHSFVSLMSADGVPIEGDRAWPDTTALRQPNSPTGMSCVLSSPRAPR
jgi:hypothetical protein